MLSRFCRTALDAYALTGAKRTFRRPHPAEALLPPSASVTLAAGALFPGTTLAREYRDPFLGPACVSATVVIARCQTWIADHYAEPAPVAAMVRFSRLPKRSFKRCFFQATGMPSLEYVRTLRLQEVKRMLEATDIPIEAVAHEVGFEDAGFFGRLLRRNVELTAGQYHERFGSMRWAVQGGSAPQNGSG